MAIQLTRRGKFFPHLQGLLITLAMVAVIELMNHTLALSSNPVPFYLTAVVGSAYVGGISGGLMSAVLNMVHALYSLSVLGEPFPYRPDHWLWLGPLALATLAVAVMAGILKRRSQNISELVEDEMGEHRKMEKVLRMNEERFRALVEASRDAIVSADSRENIVFWNKGAVEIFGYSKDEMIGKPLAALLPERFHATYRQGLERFLAGGEARVIGRTVELAGRKKDGSEFPLELSLSQWHSESGPFFTAIIRDVTKDRRAGDQIRSTLERLHALHEIHLTIGSALDWHAIIDVLLEEIGFFAPYVKAACVRLLRPETGELELVAASNVDFEEWNLQEEASLSGHSKDVVQHKSPHMVANVQTDPQTRSPEFYRKYGLVSYLGIPLLAREQVLGILAVYTQEEHEFTNEEIEFLSTLAGQAAIAIHNSQLYEQIKGQSTKLEEANRLQADFTAMIVHDLRAPLTAVMSGASMMGDGLFGPVNEEQKSYLAKIQSHIRSLVAHVNDFLDLSKLEAGSIDLAKEEVDLTRLIRDSMDTFELLTRNKKLTLKSHVDASLPQIQADPRRLEQVFANLLNNAIKFTSEGGEIEVGARQENGTEVKMWVKDSGVGIPTGEIGHLFEKYRQTASGKSSKQKGTGLGLVICKMIVEAHGGKITVESGEGKGATFTITIPYESS